MASETEIANMALSHLGIGKEIQNLDTEKSQEAGACRRFYSIARDSALQDFHWPFARQIQTLDLVTDNTAVTVNSSGYPEWRYYYRVPVACLSVRRVLSGNRNDSRDTRVPFTLVQDSAGVLLYTDMINAQIEMTVTSNDPGKYPSDFTLAFSYRLANLIAPRITGGDNFQVGERAYTKYKELLEIARARALNEEQVEQDPESEFIRARGGFDPGPFGSIPGMGRF